MHAKSSGEFRLTLENG